MQKNVRNSESVFEEIVRINSIMIIFIGVKFEKNIDMSFKLFFIALPVFFVIDMIWLVLVAKKFYQEQIGFLMKPDINWPAAIVFYLLFIAGLVIFVISPAVEKHSWVHALLYGALFGLITYATYDLTNLATLKDWPLLVTVVDLIWGTVLASSISVITYLVAQKI
jgi:uncharacterized membrane protein